MPVLVAEASDASSIGRAGQAEASRAGTSDGPNNPGAEREHIVSTEQSPQKSAPLQGRCIPECPADRWTKEPSQYVELVCSLAEL